MMTAEFIAAQRTDHGIPHAVACRALDVSEPWFYKWKGRPPTAREERRGRLDAAVRASFEGSQETYGSPRVHADLAADGWAVSVNSVADSMLRQGLVARVVRRRRGLTRADRRRRRHPDLLGRDFTAPAPNLRWVGDAQCRRRHCASYADRRTMPTLRTVLQVISRAELVGIGIVQAS